MGRGISGCNTPRNCLRFCFALLWPGLLRAASIPLFYSIPLSGHLDRTHRFLTLGLSHLILSFYVRSALLSFLHRCLSFFSPPPSLSQMRKKRRNGGEKGKVYNDEEASGTDDSESELERNPLILSSGWVILHTRTHFPATLSSPEAGLCPGVYCFSTGRMRRIGRGRWWGGVRWWLRETDKCLELVPRIVSFAEPTYLHHAQIANRSFHYSIVIVMYLGFGIDFS